MTKAEAVHNPKSYLNKAEDTERVFVLLERDQASPATIRFWCKERIRLGLNKDGDEQIEKALEEADRMEEMGPWIPKAKR